MKDNRSNRSRIFLFCGMIAPAILGATVLVVGYITPGYNPVSDTVSLTGTPEQPYAWLLSVGYWIYGILMCFGAYGLNRIFTGIPKIKPLSILLGTHALGTILLAVFPDSTTSFNREMIHNFVSGIAYAPLLAMIYIFRSLSGDSPSFSRSRLLGLLVLIINVPIPFVHIIGPLSPIGGLLQRLLCACSFVWIRFVFYSLYRKRHFFSSNPSNEDQPIPVEIVSHLSTGQSGIDVGNVLQRIDHF